jgi:hypothetical protein
MSRELKVMLKVKKSRNWDKALKKKVIPTIKSQIQKQGGNPYEDIKENECAAAYNTMSYTVIK